MILMIAPAPKMGFGAMPSGAAYFSDENRLIRIFNDSAADQSALAQAGCFTLTPFGGWGNFGFANLADMYAADTGAILPGITGFPPFTVCSVFGDATQGNNGTWYKSGTGNGAGNWTQASEYTLASLTGLVAALSALQGVNPSPPTTAFSALGAALGQVVNSTGQALLPGLNYTHRSDLGAFNSSLPALSTLLDGQGLTVRDGAFNAAANNQTFTPHAGDALYVYGAAASHFVLDQNGASAWLGRVNGVWRVLPNVA